MPRLVVSVVASVAVSVVVSVLGKSECSWYCVGASEERLGGVISDSTAFTAEEAIALRWAKRRELWEVRRIGLH